MSSSRTLILVRYELGGGMILAGALLLFASPMDFGTEAYALGVGGGLSVLLINFLYRLGVSGDLDREREAEARADFDLHGRWPDEEEQPTRPLLGRIGDALKLEEPVSR